MDNNSVLFLVDKISNATNVLQPEYKALVNNAQYIIVTIGECRLSALSMVELVQEAIKRAKEYDHTPTKVVSYSDASGKNRKFVLTSQDHYREFLRRKNMGCLVNPDGHEIYSFNLLRVGVTYTLAGSTATTPFSCKDLPAPHEIPLPLISPKDPRFVCEPGWMDRITEDVMQEFTNSDRSRPGRRVQPMAFVGCSQSGKTRALYELANHINATISMATDKPVSIIRITFADFAPALPQDEKDPLQALLQRVVFEAICHKDDATKSSEYRAFRQRNYMIDEEEVEVQWLGDSQAILLIDGLDNLKSANVATNTNARLFGDFIRYNFLTQPGRYVIFTTHVLASRRSFINVIDSSDSSDRRVILHRLPLISNMTVARQKLNPHVNAREAIYYGKLAALIV